MVACGDEATKARLRGKIRRARLVPSAPPPLTPPVAPAPRSRVRLLALTGATIALGLATRAAPAAFPGVVATYGGDVLWATMVAWLVALVQPAVRTRTMAAVALGVSWLVEVSQLVHVPWLDAVRATRVGALVLGQGFLWSDLVCYAVGAALAAGVDVAVRRWGAA